MTTRSLRKLFALFLLVNLLIVGWALTHRRSAVLKVTFLDVGQGDGAVIETPGGHVMLIDTGGIATDGLHNEGEQTVAPFLRHEGINRIDAILLTHPHADHIGGAASLIDDFPVGLLMDNGEPTLTPTVIHILTEAKAHHVDYKAARRGQEMDLGDGVKAEVLAPTSVEAAADDPNNASIVIRLTYGRTAFLLMGDAEDDEENDLLRSRLPLGCDVLKVGHHGSDTSTTPGFLAAAHPQEAVISVGRHNLYGHPSREVVTRLQQSKAHVYRTDKSGAVTCLSDGITVQVQPMHP